MSRPTARGLAPALLYEDEEDERVVYYDLDADSRRHNLLSSPDPASRQVAPRATTAKARDRIAIAVESSGSDASRAGGSLERAKEIFPRPHQPLFHLDGSSEEDEKVSEENPFASLLQQQPLKKRNVVIADAPESSLGSIARSHNLLPSRAPTSSPAAVNATSNPEANLQLVQSTDSTSSRKRNGGGRRSILKRGQQQQTTEGNNTAKRLGFEAADSRPSRWSTRKPSSTDIANRRKSLSAIQKRRSQLEASAAKRRKSMPARLLSSQHSPMPRRGVGSDNGNSCAPHERLLLDVLNRATMLSQQKDMGNDSSFSQPLSAQNHQEVNATDGDAILDTEHQMRAEPFAAQIFSPTKLSAAGSSSGRKAKCDPIIAKIRGDFGEAIRKALRKNNRDLTLLRSRGQHLLPQQSSRSAVNHHFGAIESVQERPFVIICTDRRRAVTPHSVTYECHVHEVALEVKKRLPSVLDVGSSTPMQRLDVLFQLQTADYLKLGPGKLLKIYEPLHFVPRHMAPGSSNSGASKWFLISTQLTEVVEDVHRCSGGS